MRSSTLLLVAVGLSAACGGEPRAPQAQAPVDSTPLAQAAYDPAMFDTISWPTLEAALERGQVVYRYSCMKCHGETGLGDAGFVRAGDTLRPPSFRDPDWRFANDKAGLREQVFVGTAEGMPHWGLVGLAPRDVDAVAVYILEGMRKR